MDFEFTEEQLMIKQAARDYAQRELAQDVLEREEKAEFPARHVKNLAELGFLGMMIPPEYDGGGMDTVSYVLAMEEIAKVDAAVAVIMSVNNSLVCYGLNRFGNEEQKQKIFKTFGTGRGYWCIFTFGARSRFRCHTPTYYRRRQR